MAQARRQIHFGGSSVFGDDDDDDDMDEDHDDQ